MKTVILGGNGFIGSHLVDALLARKWKVVVYDRYPERYRPPIEKVEYVLGDIGNKHLLASSLSQVDVVFHLASTTIPQSSNESPTFDIMTNLVESVQLLETCVKYQVGKVVFLSSGGTTYGVPHSIPVTEEHPTNPVSSYGIVKLAIEKYLLLFHHLHGLSYVILRPANPYGPRQNPLGGQGAVVAFLACIARGLPVTIWGDGESVRDYFHVSDLVEACVLAATSTPNKAVLNIGSGQGVSLNQLLERIQEVIETPFQVIRLPSRPFDVPKLILDVRAARTELMWEPRVSLEEGILDTWNWIRNLKWMETIF